MEVHAFRLTPGEDLKKALCAYAASRKLRASFVLTCVGSLSAVTLRLAHGVVKAAADADTRMDASLSELRQASVMFIRLDGLRLASVCDGDEAEARSALEVAQATMLCVQEEVRHVHMHVPSAHHRRRSPAPPPRRRLQSAVSRGLDATEAAVFIVLPRLSSHHYRCLHTTEASVSICLPRAACQPFRAAPPRAGALDGGGGQQDARRRQGHRPPLRLWPAAALSPRRLSPRRASRAHRPPPPPAKRGA